MRAIIQWPRAQYWDKPWNPIVGCRPCSPACDNCYARTATVDRFGQSFDPHKTKKVSPPSSGVVFAGCPPVRRPRVRQEMSGWQVETFDSLHVSATNGVIKIEMGGAR